MGSSDGNTFRMKLGTSYRLPPHRLPLGMNGIPESLIHRPSRKRWLLVEPLRMDCCSKPHRHPMVVVVTANGGSHR